MDAAVGTIAGMSWPVATGASSRSGRSGDFADAFAAAGAGEANASDDAAVATQAIAAFDLTRPAADQSAATIYAEGARQVSILQGLPAGSYDFTRITPRQMTIVGGALVAGGTVGAAAMTAVFDLVGREATSTQPVNFFAYLHQQAGENEKRPGGMATAVAQRTSLAVLTRVQADAGVPTVYDDRYPTAPRSLTVEEVNTKLKAAIVAFEKEAARTPAQRIRRDVMKDMKLTEEELKAMPQADRDATEKKIGEEVARRLTRLDLADSDGRERAAGDDAGDAVHRLTGEDRSAA